MAYKKANKEETKKPERIDVECEKLIANDVVITKLSYYPINKKGLIAKCSATINDCLVLDNILLKENAEYIITPSQSYENKDGEKQYRNEYFFIVKGKPKEFSDFIIDSYFEATK